MARSTHSPRNLSQQKIPKGKFKFESAGTVPAF